MAEETTGKCAHGACDCPPEEGSKFCSEYCKEAEKSKVMEIGFGCEHTNCRSSRDLATCVWKAVPLSIY